MGMQLIETIELASGSASIEFTSIPTDGQDLILRASLRYSSTNDFAKLTFNGDTATNYPTSRLYTSGSGVSGAQINTSYAYIPTNNSNQTSDVFSNVEVHIHAYASTAERPYFLRGGQENDANFPAYQELHGGHYEGTSAITSLKIEALSGTLDQYSSASLYKTTLD